MQGADFANSFFLGVVAVLFNFAELQMWFARIHKGYLVNLRHVEEYARGQVTLTDGEKLMISKYKYDAFVKQHLRFLRQ